MNNPKMDAIDKQIQLEVINYLETIPVKGKEDGWKLIEERLYAPKAVRRPLFRRLRLLAAAILVISISMGIFRLSPVSAWTDKLWNDHLVNLPGPLRNVVGFIIAKGTEYIEPALPKGILDELPFTPFVYTGDKWDLVDSTVSFTPGEDKTLKLIYNTALKESLTLTQELPHSKSESMWYDQQDTEIETFEIRNIPITKATFSVSKKRVWWVEDGILLTITTFAEDEPIKEFINNIEKAGS